MVSLPQEIIQAAQAATKVYKPVWPSVQLAQYGLESAWGKKVTGTNNFFGIKAVPGQKFTNCTTHEVIHGKMIEIIAAFADYDSVADAFLSHAKILATHPIYKEACAAPNAEMFAKALTSRYATAPNYGDMLIGIMRSSHLEQYDKF
jgi:flagellum-specific peptidoglycan hydrolase FlgJ